MTVSWQHDGTADRYEIRRTDTQVVVATVLSGATVATVTTVPPGTTTSYVVRAIRGTQLADSAPSNQATTMGPPDPPTNVRFLSVSNPVTIAWEPSRPNGTPVTGYRVMITNGEDVQFLEVDASTTTAQVFLSCRVCVPPRFSASVTAHSASGDSPTVTVTP